ncbi:MAG: VWA domain-containing protein [Acidobacteria bacterium]|nr:VWA domain-containing protein [Acidobacteriota bacterium]
MRFGAMVAILFLFATPHIQAQEKADSGATLEVRIINLDVVARDKAGQLVTGLTADDFVVYENGKPQTITNFVEYRDGESEAPRATAEAVPEVAPRPPEKRHLVFFFDDLDLRETGPRQDFFEGLRSFVAESMRDEDTAAVYYFHNSLENLLPMTHDRSALLAEIDKFEEESNLRLDEAKAEKAEAAMIARLAAGEGELISARGSDNDTAATTGMEGRSASQRAYDRQRRKVLAITAVIQRLAGLDGRKVMILAADRLQKFPGHDFGHRGGELNARGMMEDIVDSANASGVTIYAYFPKGLPMDPTAGGSAAYESLMNDSELLESIATRTGGTFAAGGMLSAADLGDAAWQLDNYYSLAYRAPDTRIERTRSIRVEVTRPGIEVLTRSAIVDKSEAELARDRMIAAALFGLAPSTIPISIRHGEAKRKGLPTMTVPVEITIPIAELTALPSRKGWEGMFRVLALASGRDGGVGEISEKEQPFTIPFEAFRKSREETLVYTVEIIVRDTSDRVLVAIIDDIAKEVGYAEVALDLTKASAEASRPVTDTKREWQPIATPLNGPKEPAPRPVLPPREPARPQKSSSTVQPASNARSSAGRDAHGIL